MKYCCTILNHSINMDIQRIINLVKEAKGIQTGKWQPM